MTPTTANHESDGEMSDIDELASQVTSGSDTSMDSLPTAATAEEALTDKADEVNKQAKRKPSVRVGWQRF